MTGRGRAALPYVVIVGGGVTGAAVALHLAQSDGHRGLSVTVIEPRPVIGSGLAYSTEEPAHRINVPASRMSLLPDDPGDFGRWLAASGEVELDPQAVWGNGDIYPRRRVFGRYVEERLRPPIERGHVRHLRASATRIERSADGWSVETSDGQSIAATVVVLAASHPPPGIPSALRVVQGEDGFISNPYEPGLLAGVDQQGDVLVVGTGLTSADVVAELDRRGHQGLVVALSRHGLRSREHPEKRLEPYGSFIDPPSATALDLLRRIRDTVDDARTNGLTWHPVFDRLRSDGPSIWSALPAAERAKLVHHLRAFWDVHRFRIPPQIAATVHRLEAAGRFESLAAQLLDARRENGRFSVRFRRRRDAGIETRHVDAIVNTTGPSHRSVLADNPALRSLAEAGHIRPDPYGLGIDTNASSHAVSRNGREEETLVVAGPLARGAFGELMGLPEVVRHAQTVAVGIAVLPVVQRHLTGGRAPLRQVTGLG